MRKQELYPETEKFLIYVLDKKGNGTLREILTLPVDFQKDLIAIIAEDIFHFDHILKPEKISAIADLVEQKAFPKIPVKPKFKAFVRICNKTIYPHWNGMLTTPDYTRFRKTLFSDDRIYLMDVNIVL